MFTSTDFASQELDVASFSDSNTYSFHEVSSGDLADGTALSEEQLDELLESPPAELVEDAFGRCRQKNRPAWKSHNSKYGAEYFLVNGNAVKAPKSFPLESVSHHEIEAITSLYDHSSISVDSLINDPARTCTYHTYVKVDRDVWYVESVPERMDTISTGDIQKNICAALNSKRKMKWVIGASNRKIIGCEIDFDSRDMVRQTFDFAMSTEFIPMLDPALVKLQIVEVCGSPGTTRYIIDISIDHIVENIYQLSSGRIYYLDGLMTVALAPSMEWALKELGYGKNAAGCVEAIEFYHEKCALRAFGMLGFGAVLGFALGAAIARKIF